MNSTNSDFEEIHASVLIEKLIQEAPADYFTIEWLMRELPKNSFGVIMLALSIISLVPVISIGSRILMLIIALQIILGYRSPAIPGRFMTKKVPSRYLGYLKKYIIPSLKLLEKFVRPRWPTFLLLARRITAFFASIITIISLIAPIPFADVPPALICILMSLMGFWTGLDQSDHAALEGAEKLTIIDTDTAIYQIQDFCKTHATTTIHDAVVVNRAVDMAAEKGFRAGATKQSVEHFKQHQ